MFFTQVLMVLIYDFHSFASGGLTLYSFVIYMAFTEVKIDYCYYYYYY